MVSAAYKCLSTEESRNMYNMTGSESDGQSGFNPGNFEGYTTESYQTIF